MCNGTRSDETDLENVQLAAARVVTGARRFTSHSKLYEETAWETLAQRRDKQKLILMYKIVNDIAPNYLKELLPETVQNRVRYGVRSHSKFTHIKARTNIYDDSFFPSVVRLWNSLPIETRKCESLQEFKSKINSNKDKANELFYAGGRKVNVILAKLRMGCSDLKADLYKIRVVDTPTCVCGLGYEDVFHYFFECPHYSAQRSILQTEIIPHAQFTCKTLLYGPINCPKQVKSKIYDAVIAYVKDTNRFP